jgi:purine/pyrimidine-nucleoside phosphorylase
MKHNTYFDGKVQSLEVNTEEGYATIGVMSPGSYTFNTDKEEHVVITTGNLNVRLPGTDWKIYKKNEKFVVPPKVAFEVQAEKDVSYICYYK